ncbi:MAG: formate dehydrogenase accessory sulfurtransferase FdhD [Bacillota bacterium]
MAAITAMETAVLAPVERPTTIYLNDEEWLTVQTTPVDLHDWVVGYLCGEGVIDDPGEIRRLVIEEDRGLIWVDLPAPPERQRQEPRFAPVLHHLQVTREQLLQWMREMLANAPLYRETGGVHVAMAVRADTGERFIREDIGRHNAVDKVMGAARRAGWPADQVVILTSGRISYEMCTRLARFGAGIGVSRTAATDQAYELAMDLAIELVGYVRNAASLIVYTKGTRVARRIEG